jgi:hypothetical protein
MSHRFTLPSLLAGAVAIAALAACGGTSTAPSGPGSSSNNSSGGSPSAASNGGGGSINVSSCPSTSTVGGALGVTVAAPTTIGAGGNGGLPSGATGVGCDYMAGTSVIIVTLATGLPSTWYSTEEQSEIQSESAAGLNINFTPVSGIGNYAATYDYSADGVTVDGCVAQSGGSFAGVFTSGTTASLSQIESLVKQLI